MLIKISNLSVIYEKDYILEDINLNINKNETIGILGESGSGKSTLSNCICGLINNYKGSIEYFPPIEKKKRYYKGIHLIFQDPYSSINPTLTIKEAISEGYLMKSNQRELDQLILGTMKKVGLSSTIKDKKISLLSGGERQRVAIGRGIISNPSLMIFDEATSNVDLISQRNILHTIKNLKSKGTAFIIISHDSSLLKLISDKIYLLEDKKLKKLDF